MQKIIIDKTFDNLRLDKFLFQKFSVTFSLSQKLIREKKVKVNNKKVDFSYRLKDGDEIEIFSDLKNRIINEKIRPNVSKKQIEKFFSYKIFEDKDLIALDKPSGISVQGRSLKNASIDDILFHLKKENINFHLVHRLDRDTSGVLLLAKNKKSAAFLSEIFKKKKIKKTYLAIVLGVVKKDQGEINISLKKKRINKIEKVYPDLIAGDEAISHFKVLKRFENNSLVELSPVTGRTHQLRVHMKEIGHPIINDVKYGGKKVIDKNISDRLCLHASEIKIADYFGKKLIIKSNKAEFLNHKYL